LKAVIYRKFGRPGVLHIQDVTKPIHEENEVLIKIYLPTVAREDPDLPLFLDREVHNEE